LDSIVRAAPLQVKACDGWLCSHGLHGHLLMAFFMPSRLRALRAGGRNIDRAGETEPAWPRGNAELDQRDAAFGGGERRCGVKNEYEMPDQRWSGI
jgi:hypothetical protein